MKPSPPTAKVAPLRRRNRNDRPPRAAEVGRLAHKIINQLTVIHLTCYRIRRGVNPGEPLLAAEFARLQQAVEEMHKQGELLSCLQEPDARPDKRAKAIPLRTGRGTILSLDAIRKNSGA